MSLIVYYLLGISFLVFYVIICICFFFFFFSSRRRHTRSDRDWSSDVCSSDLEFRRRPKCGNRQLRCDSRPAKDFASLIALRFLLVPLCFARPIFPSLSHPEDRKSVV